MGTWSTCAPVSDAEVDVLRSHSSFAPRCRFTQAYQRRGVDCQRVHGMTRALLIKLLFYLSAFLGCQALRRGDEC